MQVRPAVKLFVVAFLAAFLVCGLAGFEVWPLTGWRLFSQVRTDRVASWTVTVVDRDGHEEPVPFADLPAGYRKWVNLAARLPEMSEKERRGICRAWASTVQPVEQVAEVRVYRGEESLLRPGSTSGRRDLWFVCTP